MENSTLLALSLGDFSREEKGAVGDFETVATSDHFRMCLGSLQEKKKHYSFNFNLYYIFFAYTNVLKQCMYDYWLMCETASPTLALWL